MQLNDAVALPQDCVLLPLFSGSLLVSRSHAVFCRVPASSVGTLGEVIAGRTMPGVLDPELIADLRRHGFFDPPRPEKDDPPSVQLQITNACNLLCTYCCTNSGVARKDEMTYEEVCGVVERIPALLGPRGRVAILGGEPLLVPWAVDAAARILDRDLDLTLFTNGMPMTDPALAARVAQLVKRGAQVRISLAGPTAETCDAFSGTSRFETAITAINNLYAAGGEAVIDLMLFPQHVDEVAGEFHRLRGRLPTGIRIALGIAYLSGRESGQHVFPSRYELEQALDRIAFEAGETISAVQSSPLAHRREGCGCALGHHLHLRSDGTLFPCFKMEEKVGHLRVEGFEASLRKNRANPHPAAALPMCRACALATLCGAGCRSDNYLYTTDGDLPLCDTWRVRVVSELLADDWVSALDWPIHHLLAEAHRRGIEAPVEVIPRGISRHCVDL
jgi:radical SAM protein with 4Fe4S-binding SPASM domain